MAAPTKRIIILIALVFTASAIAMVVPSSSAYAAPQGKNGMQNNAQSNKPVASGAQATVVKVDSTKYTTGLPHADASGSQLKRLLSVAFAIIGALALLFVAIGALRYILAGGDSQAAAKARDTVIYASVGVIIVIAAEIIVAFVLDKL